MAATFLTVMPVPVPRGCPGCRWAGRWPASPWQGPPWAWLLAGADWLMGPWFPPMVRGALLLGALLAMTGALHLDGLMDSFDGLFGGKDPASRLAIMKDSRVGSFGVAAADVGAAGGVLGPGFPGAACQVGGYRGRPGAVPLGDGGPAVGLPAGRSPTAWPR